MMEAMDGDLDHSFGGGESDSRYVHYPTVFYWLVVRTMYLWLVIKIGLRQILHTTRPNLLEIEF